MASVTIIKHPLLEHKLGIIRNKDTNTRDFRRLVSEIGSLMAYEVTRNLSTHYSQTTTPITTTQISVLDKDIVIVPILRAGLGMVDGIMNLIPNARIAHLGLYRDEVTLQPHVYYQKFPKNLNKSTVLLVDPMLATGGSAVAAINILKANGVTDITFVGLVGVQVGIDAILTHHPDVKIYLAALDQGLNQSGYIIPGLGDCGDRIFGTEE